MLGSFICHYRESTLNGKNLLPKGAFGGNSFLLE